MAYSRWYRRLQRPGLGWVKTTAGTCKSELSLVSPWTVIWCAAWATLFGSRFSCRHFPITFGLRPLSWSARIPRLRQCKWIVAVGLLYRRLALGCGGASEHRGSPVWESTWVNTSSKGLNGETQSFCPDVFGQQRPKSLGNHPCSAWRIHIESSIR